VWPGVTAGNPSDRQSNSSQYQAVQDVRLNDGIVGKVMFIQWAGSLHIMYHLPVWEPNSVITKM
jgi:hypothetical protein